MKQKSSSQAGIPGVPAELPRLGGNMAIRKRLGAGTNKRVINHEEEVLEGKGMEGNCFGLAGRPWEVDSKEALSPNACRLDVGRNMIWYLPCQLFSRSRP